MTDLTGKVYVVTGANGGLGKATVLGLAKLGATVVMLCRDQKRGEAAQNEVKAASNSSTVDLFLADLAVMKSVREAAAHIQAKYARLDGLINNAAVYKSKRVETADGLEMMFATNHLAHFLLTNLFLEKLKASAPARVINVTAPTTTKLNFDDLQGKQRFSGFSAFGASKMCNLLFSYELARRLAGTGVTSNALHPGLMKSNLMDDLPQPFRWALNLMSSTPEKAAQGIVNLAAAPQFEGVTGKFFKGDKELTPAAYALDEQNQKRLWEISEKLTGITAAAS